MKIIVLVRKKSSIKKVSSDHSSFEDNTSSDINSNKAETSTLNCGDQSDNKNSISDIESNKFIPNENDFQMLKNN
uniref:Uncharacterized protein n=1 Tax=Candidatus Phytoplasma australasiaticum subsp. australasiaticum TaxID=2832407 RepID=A0A7S7JMA2_9MOLU|nr:hypothetical protein H7685_01775 ['Parthenium hysterophorus' phyllody phytoplasma]